MYKKYTNIFWGLSLIALGVVMLGNYIGFFSINIFFNGWWTLFIIVPSILGLFDKGDRTTSLIFLLIGILLLLNQQNIFSMEIAWKILFASIIIIVGIRIIISGLNKNKVNIDFNFQGAKADSQTYTAIFSGYERRYSNEEFEGANLTAVFGGVDLDIRDAVIKHDVVINSVAIFGGCNIIVPRNVNVKTIGTNIFGGVDNKINNYASDSPTIYLNTTSIFGGVEIK